MVLTYFLGKEINSAHHNRNGMLLILVIIINLYQLFFLVPCKFLKIDQRI